MVLYVPTLSTYRPTAFKVTFPSATLAKKNEELINQNKPPAVAISSTQTTKIGLSGTLIQTQARKFASEMGLADFKASNGWLQKFLRRYGLKHVNLHGEAGDVDKEGAEKKIETIREQLEGFDVELIFNMDETGLFFRCFPRSTYVTREESDAGLNRKTARGSKAMKAKDRCTIVACCNTTGSIKVPLAVISTTKKPLPFRHVRESPIPYYNQSSAWLDSSICQHWFDNVFTPTVKKATGRRVALLWDNCPGHIIKSDDPQITVMFLPPNVTSVYQPMDMGILHALKCGYKTEMVTKLAALIEDWDTVRAREIRRSAYARCRGVCHVVCFFMVTGWETLGVHLNLNSQLGLKDIPLLSLLRTFVFGHGSAGVAEVWMTQVRRTCLTSPKFFTKSGATSRTKLSLDAGSRPAFFPECT